MRDFTSKMANYIANLTYEDLSDEVIHHIKLLIIDNLANIIGGRMLMPSKIYQDLFRQYGGKGESTLFTTGEKTSAPIAANVNSYISNILDFDDTYESFAHPGATIIPPAFSVAEREHKSGKDLIIAIFLGYEVSLRIGRSIYPSRERREKVWGFATWQAFGSMVSTAKLLGLNVPETCDAFGLAGMSAPVPSIRKLGMKQSERPFTWLKNNYGTAAMTGVIASDLARKNFLGNRSILDGENGFWIMAGSDIFDPSELVNDLGSKVLSIETSFKPYAACRWAHATLDAVRGIKKKANFSTRQIKKIKVYTFNEAKQCLSEHNPKNVIDAQFSLPYLIALELRNRSSAQGLKEKDLTDSSIKNLAKLVVIIKDENFEIEFSENREMKSTVEIYLNSGEKISQIIEVPRGDRRNPISEKEIKEKFYFLTDSFPSRKLLNDIYNIEKVNDITKMVNEWFEKNKVLY